MLSCFLSECFLCDVSMYALTSPNGVDRELNSKSIDPAFDSLNVSNDEMTYR